MRTSRVGRCGWATDRPITKSRSKNTASRSLILWLQDQLQLLHGEVISSPRPTVVAALHNPHPLPALGEPFRRKARRVKSGTPLGLRMEEMPRTPRFRGFVEAKHGLVRLVRLGSLRPRQWHGRTRRPVAAAAHRHIGPLPQHKPLHGGNVLNAGHAGIALMLKDWLGVGCVAMP